MSRTEIRARVERMLRADYLRSDRSISRAAGCSHATVGAVRRELEGLGQIDRRPVRPVSERQAESGRNANLVRARAGEPGLAEKHGAYSEARRAPLEEMHREQLRLEYQNAPDTLINASARRLAMVSLFSAFIAEVGVVHRGSGGLPAVSDAARELRLLLRDHESAVAALAEIEREAATRDPSAALRAHVAQLQTRNGGGGPDGVRDD